MSRSTKSTKPITPTATTAARPGATFEPPVYSPEAGKHALHALLPVLAGISEADFASNRVDVEFATYAALGVAGFVGDPQVRARYARLPSEEFDIAAVDGLATACFAMLYALSEARSAGALETDVKVPVELVAEAAQLEARMQALCEYHFADDPEIKPELDRLRPGIGYRDLANDLLGYARVYEMRPDVVSADQKHHRAGDAARAKQIAGTMIQALSSAMTPKAREAWTLHARAWTLLCRRYDEVRGAGLWLFRRDPQREARFPSLFNAARANNGRPRKQPVKTETLAGNNGAPPAETAAGSSPTAPATP